MTSASVEPARKPGSSARGVLLALLLLTGFAAHLQLRAAIETQVDRPMRADAVDYYAGALNMARFGVYSRTYSRDGSAPAPDAVRSPGYSLFLYPLLGDSEARLGAFVRRVMIAQALLAVLLVPLSYLLARRILPTTSAVIVAALVAITPQLVTASTYVLSEIPFAFAMTAALLALGLLVEKPDRRSLAFGVGLLIGAAALIRPTVQFLPFVVAGFLALKHANDGRRAALLVLLGFAIPFGAWTGRNVVTLGMASDPTLTIGTIHHGSYPAFLYQDDLRTFGFPYRSDPRTPEATKSFGSLAAHVASAFEKRPLRMLSWYLVEKPFYLVAWEPIQGAGDVFILRVVESPYLVRSEFIGTKQLMHALHWPLMLLGYVGAIVAWLPVTRRTLGERGAAVARLLSLVLAYVVAIHIIAAPFPRYSVPFRPLQYALAALAAYVAFAAWRRRVVE